MKSCAVRRRVTILESRRGGGGCLGQLGQVPIVKGLRVAAVSHIMMWQDDRESSDRHDRKATHCGRLDAKMIMVHALSMYIGWRYPPPPGAGHKIREAGLAGAKTCPVRAGWNVKESRTKESFIILSLELHWD